MSENSGFAGSMPSFEGGSLGLDSSFALSGPGDGASLSSSVWGGMDAMPVRSADSTTLGLAGSLDLSNPIYGAPGDVKAGAFDAGKGVSQLIADGTLQKSQAEAPRHTPLEQGESPKITVTADQNKPADFVVKADGKIEVNGNPEAGKKPHSEYVVRVEPGADVDKTDGLVEYLKERIAAKAPGAKPSLEADMGLVSDRIRDLFKPEEKPDDEPDDQPEPPSPPGPGPSPGPEPGPGPGPRPEPPDDHPDDDDGKKPDDGKPDDGKKPDDAGPPIPGPEDRLPVMPSADAMRDVISANSSMLGNYNSNLGNWFSSIMTDDMIDELGHPPDYSKLGKVLKKHKNNPAFRQKLDGKKQSLTDQGDSKSADKLDDLVNNIADNAPVADRVGQSLNGKQGDLSAALGKEGQDAITSSRMADLARDMGIKFTNMSEKDAGRLAVGLKLGKVPGEDDLKQNATLVKTIEDQFKAKRGV